MNSKLRIVVLAAAVLAVGILAFGVVFAQDDAATPEVTAEATAEPTEQLATRPVLGVWLEDAEDGATIAEVIDGLPADEAGLLVGDVITAINGEAATDAASVAAIVQALNVGDVITIDFTRDGEAQSVEATLAEQTETELAPVRPPRQPRNQRGAAFGLDYDGAAQTWTISSLPEDNALYAAGLREGDVIVRFDGDSYDPAGLRDYLRSLGADAAVTVTVERDGAEQDITINIADLRGLAMPFGLRFGRGEGGARINPEDFFQMLPPGAMALGYGNGWLGVEFVTLSADNASEFDADITDGAVITAVVEESPAAEAGLQENDIVTAVNGEPVDEERTLRDRLIAYEPDDTVTLTVLRAGEELDIDVTLGEPAFSGDYMRQFRDMLPGGGFRFEIPRPAVPETPEAPAAHL